jgi:leucyl/phenylalanyl-tRNA--protein transferase
LYLVSDELFFPPVEHSNAEGILAMGGDLNPERLILAYKSGIFPWFNPGEPVIWWSPNPRMVLFLDEFTPSKSMRNILNRNIFEVTFNQNFREVLFNCKSIKREGQDGTWITDDMAEAYSKLHDLGIAKSVEVWQNGILVGGLYGIDLGHVFCGESMFATVSNASKVAFVALVNQLKASNYSLLDCQVYNEHLESLGCREIERDIFIKIITSK